jgi:hypothetical protein
MTTNFRHSIAQQLTDAHLLIYNSLVDPEILARVAAFGYRIDKLNTAKALHKAAEDAFNTQKARSGDQQQITADLAEAQAAAHDAYQALAKVARAIFIKDRGRLSILGITGGRVPQSIAGFLGAARILFNNAADLTELADYGYDAAKLASERLKITALEELNQRQESAKGAAQQATVEREAAFQALHEWTAQYRKIARVALRDNPPLLEKIGIPVRPPKRAVRKEDGEKETPA